MRILFVTPYLPSLVRVRPYQFVRELSRRHEITLVATDSNADGKDADGLRGICRELCVVPMPLTESLRGCLAAAMRGDPLQSAFCSSAELERRLTSILAEKSFDLVHIEHLRAARLVSLVPQEIPTVFDSVDCISLLLERTLRASHSLFQRFLATLELGRCRRFESRILRRFDRVAVTSPEDRCALNRLAPGAEVAVVPNGVDLEYFRPLEGPREPATLVFSGKMSYHANVSA
ncbi:MAG TPA: glycosyltransferase, partial [Chloroflexota bacterium]|nr:glycosyltransferase [Chloroflexota bacterium]